MKFLNFILLGFQSSAGFIMWVILLVGVIGFAIAIERFIFLYLNADKGTGAFMKAIGNFIKQGDFEKATRFCSQQKTPISKAVLAILQNRAKGSKAVKKAVDEVFLEESPKLKRNIHLLNMFANIATLIGLTGTIYGTMECFDAIANAPAAQRAQQLASGISVTMSATLFGLCVAVPNVIFHGVFSGKADKIIEDMDEKTAKLANAIEE